MNLFWWLVLFGVFLMVAGPLLLWAICSVGSAADHLFDEWTDDE